MDRNQIAYIALKIKDLSDGEYLLLDKSNFSRFLAFIPDKVWSEFYEQQKLRCPEDLNSAEFSIWISYVLRRLGQKRGMILKLCGLEKTKFSKFMNGKGNLDFDRKNQIKNYLQQQLRESGLVL